MSAPASVERRIIDLATGAWRTQALYVAARLRLPDLVADGHRSAAALAAACGAEEDRVRRWMRLLVGLGVFDGDDATGYRETDLSTALREREAPSLRDLCLSYGDEFYRAWGHADATLTSGRGAFEHATGSDLHTYLRERPEAADRFQRTMSAGNVMFEQVPRAAGIGGDVTVVDVAGGNGELLAAVLTAAPRAVGVLADLEHVIPIGRRLLSRTVGIDRVRLVGGDVFESVPSGGDVYLLSRVLQDWDDDACVRLLANCRRAMHPGARLVVLERVIPEPGEDAVLPLLWDLHLLIISGGRERTLDGYRDLLARAGLHLERHEPLPLEASALVATPVAGARDTRPRGSAPVVRAS